MENKTRLLIQATFEAEDYRTFLSQVFEASTKSGKKFNFAAFSRKAGFSSRGFIKEVLDGRKRLTSLSFPKVLKALALPLSLRQFFTYLVILEEPELNHDKLTQVQISHRLSEIREKLKAQLEQTENEGSAAQALFKSYHILEVYSVLGNRQQGIDLSEVQRRTGLELEICQRVLRQLVEQKVITVKAGRYKSLNPLYIFEGFGANEGFKNLYLETLGLMKRKANTHFKSHDQLFYQSFFSVSRQHIPELKRRLREVVTEFVEASENDDGDCVSKLMVGLFV
jgi:uncharacterized protein (TIGR02147 family)